MRYFEGVDCSGNSNAHKLANQSEWVCLEAIKKIEQV